MKLRVLHNVNSATYHYKAGTIIEVSKSFGEWLMRDSASSFEVVPDESENKAIDKPPADKMMRRGRGKVRTK